MKKKTIEKIPYLKLPENVKREQNMLEQPL